MIVFLCGKFGNLWNEFIAMFRICEYNIICVIMWKGVTYVDFMSTKEAGLKWGITTRLVQILCNQGRIKNVTRLGNVWAIPKDAVKPEDARKK